MIIHNVYWTLKEDSAEARRALIDGCWRYLSSHPGILHFWAGELAVDHVRSVNDRDWDVGLHVVYENKAAHDYYHEHPLHDQFVAEFEGNWKSARVFDSVVSLRESAGGSEAKEYAQ